MPMQNSSTTHVLVDDKKTSIVISFRDATCYWNRHPSSSSSSTPRPSDTLSTLIDPSVLLAEETTTGGEDGVDANIVALSSIHLDIVQGELCCILVSKQSFSCEDMFHSDECTE